MPVELSVINTWKVLHREWKAAEKLARDAQGESRLSFERGRLGSAGPTIDAVRRADELQRQADLLRIALDAHVESAMKLPQ
ncbi:hypothetical protein RCH10_005072 [Variovorax sp. GrIS 2.14]|uniref:hypothetical protein n=1 Tax=Variovorax sp. GrIS 2.14 TaxID=3071709 RepID=UPI0038F6E20D